jgi:hypothetical protein
MWAGLTFEWRGPLWVRSVLQPVMAVTVAIRDGIKGARTGRSPYLLIRGPVTRATNRLLR